MKNIKKYVWLLAVVLLAAAGGGILYGKVLDRFFPLKYEEHIERYSKEYKLDKYLVMSVIRAESRFNHTAHSGIARGLMQITDDTAKWIATQLGMEYFPDMVEEPETNIKMGCYYLSYLTKHYGSVETALAAYNAGMGNVCSWLADSRYSKDGKTLSDVPYGETKRYVERVKKLVFIYKKLY